MFILICRYVIVRTCPKQSSIIHGLLRYFVARNDDCIKIRNKDTMFFRTNNLLERNPKSLELLGSNGVSLLRFSKIFIYFSPIHRQKHYLCALFLN
jgi:hypothetical protein